MKGTVHFKWAPSVKLYDEMERGSALSVYMMAVEEA